LTAVSARDLCKDALRHLERRDAAAALGALDAALDLDPACASALQLRGLVRLRRGRLDGRADLLRACALDPTLAHVAGRALATAGLWCDAADAFAAAATVAASPEVLRDLGDASLRAGRYSEGLDALRRAVALAPHDRALRVQLAEHLRTLGDPAGALDVVGRGTAPRLEALALLALERFDEAAALVRTLADASALERAGLLLACGALAEARGLAASAAEGEPRSAAPVEILATLDSWAGDHRAARTHAERALAIDPRSVAALRVRAAAKLLDGDDEAGAAADLDAALAAAPDDGETLVWRAELRARRREHDAALADFERGTERMRGYALGAHVARAVMHLEQRTNQGQLDQETYREIIGLLRTVGGEPPAPPAADAAIARWLRRCLEAMHGNRSSRVTFVENGVLRPLDPPLHSRFLTRELQERLRVQPPQAVLGALARLAAERPTEPTILCHLGEVHLWLGAYDEAAEAFERALAVSESTRWAYVGLCAAAMLRGRHTEAIDWCRRAESNVMPGRTQYVYRGEAYRRLGERDRAIADLERSQQITPSRMSGTMNLALARGSEEALVDAWAAVWRAAPSLCTDACTELAVELEQAADHVAKLFEHMLAMMRGNRSSSFVTYFTAEGRLRFSSTPRTRRR
jgi:tetratricopeptide (TPR) repeat protein